ncbi:hypothetical protein F4810DRAFT_44109 [Camillea tinctor]|nr:hypothetical protein F4810DRAFT_44109 [Camillea tinctor]
MLFFSCMGTDFSMLFSRYLLRETSRTKQKLPPSLITHITRMYSNSTLQLIAYAAILYQALQPPVINGTKKPRKPGGYQDSGAEIAFNLCKIKSITALTPFQEPNPAELNGWTFPDTEEGILHALNKGATHIWANTILFTSHPLQTSETIGDFQDSACGWSRATDC